MIEWTVAYKENYISLVTLKFFPRLVLNSLTLDSVLLRHIPSASKNAFGFKFEDDTKCVSGSK